MLHQTNSKVLGGRVLGDVVCKRQSQKAQNEGKWEALLVLGQER